MLNVGIISDTIKIFFKTSLECLCKISPQIPPIALGSGYNHTVGGFDATKIEVWGEEHPEYHLTLQLYNPEEMLMHNFGTIRDDVSIRDMNGGATNKIYCTSFATDGEMVSGTEYNYVASWSFSIDRNFEQPTREPDVYVIKGK